MKGLAAIFICVLALTIRQARTEDEEVELNEQGCPTNYTIPGFLPGEYCNKFYQCVNGEPWSLDCPNGLVYNIEEQTCDWPNNVDCTDRPIYVSDVTEESTEVEDNTLIVYDDPSVATEVCQQENTAYVLIANENCNQFYQCVTGAPVAITCPNNLLFNTTSGACDWPDNVDCGDRYKEVLEEEDIDLTNATEVCTRSQYNGLVLPHDEYCNWFYMCANGQAAVLECPLGLVYNSEEQACDWPLNVECDGKAIAEPKENDIESSGDESDDSIYGYADPSEAVAICQADGSDGKLIAHENCNQFYKCWNKIPVVFDCVAGLNFNPDNGVCDWPYNVDCGNRTV